MLLAYGIKLFIESPSSVSSADLETAPKPKTTKTTPPVKEDVSINTSKARKKLPTPVSSDDSEAKEEEEVEAQKLRVGERPGSAKRLDNETFVALRSELKPLVFECLQNDKISDANGVKEVQFAFDLSWDEDGGKIRSKNLEKYELEEDTLKCIESHLKTPEILGAERPNLDKYPISYSFAWE